jgi:hypothetical protein
LPANAFMPISIHENPLEVNPSLTGLSSIPPDMRGQHVTALSEVLGNCVSAVRRLNNRYLRRETR